MHENVQKRPKRPKHPKTSAEVHVGEGAAPILRGVRGAAAAAAAAAAVAAAEKTYSNVLVSQSFPNRR